MSKHLWQPSEKRVRESSLEEFIKFANLEPKKNFKELWEWSVTKPEIFWSKFWDYSKIIGNKGKEIIRKDQVFNKTKFFPDSKINYSENILKKRTEDIAINFLSEKGFEENITWSSLYEKVCKFSSYLKSLDLKKGDRVAAYVPNKIESIISFLACAKIGVIWSSCSPDFGIQGVVDRFKQIEPKILITSDYYFYNGKRINILDKVNSILNQIPSLKKTIYFIIFSKTAAFVSHVIFVSLRNPGLNQALNKCLKSLSNAKSSLLSFNIFNKSSLKATIIAVPLGAIFILLKSSLLLPSETLNKLDNVFSF